MKYIKTVTAIILASLMLISCGSNPDGTKVASTVNGESVSYGLLSFDSHYQAALFNTYYGAYLGENYYDEPSSEDGNLTNGDQSVDYSLDSIEDKILMSQHAEEFGATLSDDEKAKIDSVAQAIMDANPADTMKRMGVSKDDIAKSLTLDTIRQKIYEPMVKDVDTNVDPDEVAMGKITYIRRPVATEDDAESGKTADEINAETEQQLKDIAAAVEATGDVAGADIEAIAKTFQEDIYAYSVNIYTKKENENYDKLLMDNALALNEGEITDVPFRDTDGSGYYIVRLDTKNDEEAIKSETEKVISQRKQEKFEEIVKGWRDASEISRDEKVVRSIKLTSKEKYILKTGEEE